LEHALSRISSHISKDDKDPEPLYIYGDFNFRLDFSAVVKVPSMFDGFVCGALYPLLLGKDGLI